MTAPWEFAVADPFQADGMSGMAEVLRGEVRA